MKNTFYLILLLSLNIQFSNAQISPPGLGNASFASWTAVGLRNNLDSLQRIESMTYLGLGFKDESKHIKPSLFVINQELYYKLNADWKSSLAGSYRTELNNNSNINKQEFRIYGRISYNFNIGNTKLTETFRQEIRKFTDQNFKNLNESLQLRTRLKLQFSTPLSHENAHQISGGAEMLFALSKNENKKEWTNLSYTESRFTLFYTYRPKETAIAISLGYMNNLIQKENIHSVNYASIDFVFENPI